MTIFIRVALLASIILIAVPFVDAGLAATEAEAAAQSVAKRAKRKGRYVYRKTWNGTRWTTRKVRVGTRSTRKKSWRTGRKVVSRTKKIVS